MHIIAKLIKNTFHKAPEGEYIKYVFNYIFISVIPKFGLCGSRVLDQDLNKFILENSFILI